MTFNIRFLKEILVLQFVSQCKICLKNKRLFQAEILLIIVVYIISGVLLTFYNIFLFFEVSNVLKLVSL